VSGEVGEALSAIREGKLYRATHGTFEDYCREKWNMSRGRVYQLIGASETVSTIVDKSVVTTESQARELSRVEPARREEVVAKAVEATGGKLTAAAIREAAQPDPHLFSQKKPVVVWPIRPFLKRNLGNPIGDNS